MGKGAAAGAIIGGVGGAILGDQNARTASRPVYSEPVYYSPAPPRYAPAPVVVERRYYPRTVIVERRYYGGGYTDY
jgi:hypothetical protein